MTFGNANNHDGDVVGGTLVQALGNEFVAGKFRIINGEQRLCNIALRDITAQTIRAQQPLITWLSIHDVRVNVGLGVHISEHPHQDTPSGVNGRFFRRDATAIDETLNKSVVSGDLLQDTFAQAINSRVTDVSDDHGGLHSDHRTDRGSHAGELRVFDDRFGQLRTSIEDAVKKLFSSLFDTRVRVIKGIQVLNRDGAGNVAARVTAHAIGDDVEVPAHGTRVLITCPNLADMGRGGTQNAVGCHGRYRRSSNALVPIVTGVFSGTGVGMLTLLPSTKVPLVESKS